MNTVVAKGRAKQARGFHTFRTVNRFPSIQFIWGKNVQHMCVICNCYDFLTFISINIWMEIYEFQYFIINSYEIFIVETWIIEISYWKMFSRHFSILYSSS